jgi:hypothetical protein
MVVSLQDGVAVMNWIFASEYRLERGPGALFGVQGTGRWQTQMALT